MPAQVGFLVGYPSSPLLCYLPDPSSNQTWRAGKFTKMTVDFRFKAPLYLGISRAVDSGGIHQSGGKRGGPERGCEGGAFFLPWDATAQ